PQEPVRGIAPSRRRQIQVEVRKKQSGRRLRRRPRQIPGKIASGEAPILDGEKFAAVIVGLRRPRRKRPERMLLMSPLEGEGQETQLFALHREIMAELVGLEIPLQPSGVVRTEQVP